MRFRFAPLALLAALAITGCDSDGSTRILDDLDGTYEITELVFDPVTASLPDADVGALLDSNETSLQIFGGDGTVQLISSRDGQRTLTTLDATATRGRVTLTAQPGDNGDNEAELRTLFLPRQFTLTYDPDSPRTLSGDIQQSDIDLQAFDPDLYQDQRAVRGTLRIRLSRTS